MSNISKAFENGKAFIPFITCGDPDLETTAAVVRAAVENGAEVVVSADIPHHVLLSALENGLCVLACTHYDTEIYGFEKFFRFAAERFKNENIYFYRDERLS